MITHLTAYQYPQGANRLSLLLRLWPEPFAGLSIRQWQVTINDALVKPAARNGYGERTALWSAPALPGPVAIQAQGIVEVEDRAGVVAGLGTRVNPAVFLRTTRRTEANDAIRALAEPPPATDRLAWLHQLMATVRSRVDYVTGSTGIDTSAAEALAAGSGVCQDHAQLFIAAAREHGVPARYVCGYLLAADDHMALHETHAWAEAFVEGLGWVGFDPSNGLCPTERYVRLCVGLDAVDAAPIRGHASGGQALGLYADVRISPADGMTPDDAPADITHRDWQTRMQQQ